ncbi:MAG: hypothetical protein IPM24_08550 [Bryobacterales bacterium]|nr:hypothetical protein [Bryobacterales bacterium]
MKHLIALILIVAAGLAAAERFDHQVREMFFAGYSGNRPALEKAMAVCESILQENPEHAEALVWSGGGLLFLAGELFQRGDGRNGTEAWQRGLERMDRAVRLEPGNLAVRIPRGAAVLQASNFVPNPPTARSLLERGVSDYEFAYKAQESVLDQMSGHAIGELLVGLADGHRRLGNADQAKHYFQKLLAVGAKSGHEAEAKEYLETGTLGKPVRCVGCHTR